MITQLGNAEDDPNNKDEEQKEIKPSTSKEFNIESRNLTLQLEPEVCQLCDDSTPQADFIAETTLHQDADHRPRSLDLDDKFTSMTGSYSEILDGASPETRHSDITSVPEDTDADELNKSPGCGRDDLLDGALMSFHLDNQENSAPGASKMYRQYELDSDRITNALQNLYSLHGSLYPLHSLVDPTVLTDLEECTRRISTSMDSLTENLTETLHGISALSVDCIETYRDAVCKTCDAVDSNIKSMYQLMAKCEELSKAITPMYKLHQQIKEIHRLLDLFENAVYSGGT